MSVGFAKNLSSVKGRNMSNYGKLELCHEIPVKRNYQQYFAFYLSYGKIVSLYLEVRNQKV